MKCNVPSCRRGAIKNSKSGRCAFHAPLGEKEPEKFWKKFEDYFKTTHAKLTGGDLETVLDCTGFIFPDTGNKFKTRVFEMKACFENAEFGRANFAKAEFKQTADFSKALFKDKAEFNNTKFNGRVLFNSTKFERDALFGQVEFAGYVSFYATEFKRVTIFSLSKFKDETSFEYSRFGHSKNQSAIFADVQFEGDADFSETSFAGQLNLRKSTFKFECRFIKAKFSDDVDFEEAKLIGDADFSGAAFNGRGIFHYTEFGAKATFATAVFNSFAHFEKAKFGNASFDSTVFKSRVDFGGVTFVSRASFQYAKFHNIGHFVAIGKSEGLGPSKIKTDSEVYFSYVDLFTPDARLIFDALNLRDWSFGWTVGLSDYRLFQFEDVEWKKKGDNRKFTRDEDLAINEKGEFLCEMAAEVYRRLRKNYEDRLAYDTASDFHIGQMEMHLLNPSTSKPKKFFLWWYKWISNFGESVGRPLWWFTGLWLVFALIWSLKGFEYNGGSVNLDLPRPWLMAPGFELAKDIGRGLLYSLKTFLSLPDLKEGVLSQTLGAVQRLAGASIATLFILALRRAFRR
jgi:uncharacterized protein YjbI with pentapeptide repeats